VKEIRERASQIEEIPGSALLEGDEHLAEVSKAENSEKVLTGLCEEVSPICVVRLFAWSFCVGAVAT
jgi:hypothetical protein